MGSCYSDMNRLTLTSAKVIAPKQSHRDCKDKRAADRIKAVYLLQQIL